MDLYVYYRALRADALSIECEVGRLQQQLQQHSGVRCGLKQRLPLDEVRDTWMEIYLAVPADSVTAFAVALAAAAAASPLQRLIDGDRHVEYFLDCLPCA